MADGSLYDTDFVAWTEQQARLLRESRTNEPFDLDNLAEEIESLGRSDLRALRSQTQLVIEHLLKLQFSPNPDPHRGWAATLRRARRDIEMLLDDSPSLRARIVPHLERDRAIALQAATLALEEHGEPAAAIAARQHGGAYTIDEIFDAERSDG